MANLKEIRIRISSVISTRQITSAMKMVSASKLRKAQDAIVSFRPYANILDRIVARLGENPDDLSESPFFSKRPLNKVLIIAVASNKGLCGSFNTNVFKMARQLAEEKYPKLYAEDKVDFFCIGKKAADAFKSRNMKIAGSENILVERNSTDRNFAMADKLMQQYIAKEYDVIEFVYNRFKNAAVQTTVSETLLPLSIEKPVEKERKKYLDNYIFEPGIKEIIEGLIPFVLKTKVNKVIFDSIASEHGARMTAMHKATDNASELLNQLRLSYNKARQASITNEILEIVTGANALKG
jgi:F-type H+-transporting ATPase subunit gamma